MKVINDSVSEKSLIHRMVVTDVDEDIVEDLCFDRLVALYPSATIACLDIDCGGEVMRILDSKVVESVNVFKVVLRDVGDMSDKDIGRYCYDYLEPHHKGADIVVLDIQCMDGIVDVYLKVSRAE